MSTPALAAWRQIGSAVAKITRVEASIAAVALTKP